MEDLFMANKQTDKKPVSEAKQIRRAKARIGVGAVLATAAVGLSIATAFGFLVDSVVWLASGLVLLPAGAGLTIPSFRKLKTLNKSKQVSNNENLVEKQFQAIEEKEKVDVVKKAKVEVKESKNFMDNYRLRTNNLENQKNYFAIYEEDGKTLKQDNGKNMAFQISGDNDYIKHLYQFISQAESSNCVVVVCDDEGKKNTHFLFKGEYSKTMPQVINEINQISKSLRQEELVPQV